MKVLSLFLLKPEQFIIVMHFVSAQTIAKNSSKKNNSNIIFNNQCVYINFYSNTNEIRKFVEVDGQRYSHIIDPFTGLGIRIPRVVTVLAADCTTKDVLASIFSIEGPIEGFEFLKIFNGVE